MPRADRLVLSVLATVGVIAILFALTGCGGWKRSIGGTLTVAQRVAARGHDAAVKACRPALEGCRSAGRTTPATCPELVACQARRRVALQLVETVATACVLGWTAIEEADKRRAESALQAAVAAGQRLVQLLQDTWGVALPEVL